MINQIHAQAPAADSPLHIARLRYFSAVFRGRPYLLGALGEGAAGRFDQSPLYRTDAFDCLTYVNTVLALCLAQNSQEFPQKMAAVNYRNGEIAYEKRHHFMSVDWNLENARLGIIRDITLQIFDEHAQPIAAIAETWIDRPNWFRHRQLSDIKLLQPLSTEHQQQRLQEMRGLAAQVTIELACLPYLPLTQLFTPQGQPKTAIFAQIPDGAIIEIVRPNWDLREKIGTCLDVSHLGFAFWQQGVLIFREASLIEKRIIDIPLTDYLYHYLNHPTIKGINIQGFESLA